MKGLWKIEYRILPNILYISRAHRMTVSKHTCNNVSSESGRLDLIRSISNHMRSFFFFSLVAQNGNGEEEKG